MSQSPGPRDHLGMAYDSDRNKIVIHSGNDTTATGKYSWDPTTWEWDANGWKQVDNGTPGGVSSHAFVYDPRLKACISIGGVNGDYENVDKAYMWNGSTWQVQHEGPGERLSSAMAFDPVRNEMVLFSGCGGKKYPTDTWILKEDGWSQQQAEGPAGLCRAAAFFDEVRGTVVVFGGSLETRDKSSKMFEWNGTTWSAINQGDLVPAARANIQMAYDKRRKRAVLFAGKGDETILDDLWEWDGERWWKIPKQPIWPEGVEVYGTIYHEQLQKIFYYGGRSGWATPTANFWSWDGEKWEEIK